MSWLSDLHKFLLHFEKTRHSLFVTFVHWPQKMVQHKNYMFLQCCKIGIFKWKLLQKSEDDEKLTLNCFIPLEFCEYHGVGEMLLFNLCFSFLYVPSRSRETKKEYLCKVNHLGGIIHVQTFRLSFINVFMSTGNKGGSWRSLYQESVIIIIVYYMNYV